MEHVESGVALIALRSGVPMIPLYIGSKPRLFRRLDVRVGDRLRWTTCVSAREPRYLRGTARPHHRNLPRADGTPGGVSSILFPAFACTICLRFFRAGVRSFHLA